MYDDYMDDAMAILLNALGLQESDIDDRQRKNIVEFIRVSQECDDEILGGIDHQIPMTAGLYHRTINKLEELGAKRTLMEFRSDFKDFSN